MNYYKTAIKEVIGKFPKLGELLGAYGVGCAGCSVGTCLLKDVLDIHNFPQDQKKTITALIDKIINNEPVDIPRGPVLPGKNEKAPSYSAPLQQLVGEHKNILRLLDLAQYIAGKKHLGGALKETAAKVLFYVRNYADKYHHAKEENILFKTAEETEIIKAMRSEHETARGFIAEAAAGLETDDEGRVKKALSGYVALLREHIKKEDDILYPWFDRTLDHGGKEELLAAFGAADKAADKNLCAGLLKFLDENFS